MNIKRDLEFLFEISAFRNVERTWKQFLNPDVANNVEHTFRVLWIALMLAKYEGVKSDEKIMKMALIHDLGESRSVDVHYLSRQYTEVHEEEAFADTIAGTQMEEEYKKLFSEYEARKSVESKIVKDADTLDVQIELKELEHKGHTLPTVLNPIRDTNNYHKLYTKSAKEFWKSVRDGNPHDWHVHGRNRYTAGDWKEVDT